MDRDHELLRQCLSTQRDLLQLERKVRDLMDWLVYGDPENPPQERHT